MRRNQEPEDVQTRATHSSIDLVELYPTDQENIEKVQHDGHSNSKCECILVY